MSIFWRISHLKLIFVVVFFLIEADLINLHAEVGTGKSGNCLSDWRGVEKDEEKMPEASGDIKVEKSEEGKNENKNKDADKNKVEEKEKDRDKGGDKEEKYLKIGNLSLRASQQPGPLVSFGERVLDQGEIQLFLFGDGFFGKKNYDTELLGSFVYGITDTLSIYFDVPYAPANKYGNDKSSGIKDLIVQVEYAFYSGSEETWGEQATIVGAIQLPTGSHSKDPPTGLGSPSFFMGLTFNRTEFEWVYFCSTGVHLTTRHRNFKAGNEFLYQGGIGRNICTPPGWIYAGIVEVIGLYTWQDRTNGQKDPDSGGNVIAIVPSIWISSEKTIFQLGVGYSVVEHLFGDQRKAPYSVYFNVGWTFN